MSIIPRAAHAGTRLPIKNSIISIGHTKINRKYGQIRSIRVAITISVSTTHYSSTLSVPSDFLQPPPFLRIELKPINHQQELIQTIRPAEVRGKHRQV